jgi:hypothetical protein
LSSETAESPTQKPERAPHDGPRDLSTGDGTETFLTAQVARLFTESVWHSREREREIPSPTPELAREP